MFRPKEKFKPINIDGVEIDNVPLTKIVYNRIDIESIAKEHFDYVIFTSSIAVDAFKSQFKNYEEFLKGSNVISIGSKTSDALGLKSTIPKIQSSKGIIDLVKNNSSILLVRSENGNPYLIKKLKERASRLTIINAYGSVYMDKDFKNIYEALKNGNYDAIIFTSSMIFNTYIKIFSQYGDPLEILPGLVLAIGDETSRSMKRYNLNPIVMEVPDVEMAVKKIVSLIGNTLK